MSVYVSDFTSPTVWQITHDDAPGGTHTGNIDPATVVHTLNMDGTEDHDFLVIVCPVCQSSSTHPVGGGAQPRSVQQMFVSRAQTTDCPCGQVKATDSAVLVESHVRLQVNRQDGPGRWRLA
jgi:hypothetical protein